MCGIAGALYRDRSRASPQILEAMGAQIRHRGPDGGAVRALGCAGLAFRRLAIIDLTSAADQPMASEDGNITLIFNGEIYNFLELKQELIAKGHTFRSTGDAEVILRLYQEEGIAAIPRLDGMFAIALWDARTQQLLLARDRTGKKPLFVYDDGKKVVFGSEIKSILAHPDVDDSLWPPAVAQYFTFGYVPSPNTFYKRIHDLPPASCQVLRPDRPADPPKRYWDFPVMSSLGRCRAPPALPEVEERIRDLFTAAVKRRLISDVPLGAFLSGGIDSTLVVAVMSQLLSRPVKTFSIGFEGQPQYDETAFARMAAARFGAEHTEFKVQPGSFELIDKLSWHYDQPYGDSSAIPTYIVAKLSRQHVTVALTGDGGDELFAGYDRFVAASVAEAMPRFVWKRLRGLSRHFPSRNGRSFLARSDRFLTRAAEPLGDRFRHWNSYFSTSELNAILSPELSAYATRELIAQPYQEVLDTAQDADLINQLLYLNARTYLLDDLNVKMDRATMAVSLESRAPFLDTALMDYVFRLPGNLKAHGRIKKWILKRAFRDVLPDEIARRPKMGFGIPLGPWFRGELRGYAQENLLNPKSRLYPMLNHAAVQKLMDDHQSGRRDVGNQFWMFAMLERWLERRAAAGPEAGRIAS